MLTATAKNDRRKHNLFIYCYFNKYWNAKVNKKNENKKSSEKYLESAVTDVFLD
jgi:hypothetical protein